MITPLPGFVLLKPIEEENKVNSVYLPEKDKDKPSRGIVIETGGPIQINGEWHNCPKLVRQDKTVIYKKWTNQEVKEDGEKYLLVGFGELLAVIK